MTIEQTIYGHLRQAFKIDFPETLSPSEVESVVACLRYLLTNRILDSWGKPDASQLVVMPNGERTYLWSAQWEAQKIARKHMVPFPPDFPWDIGSISKGQYRGTLNTRLANYIYKTYNIRGKEIDPFFKNINVILQGKLSAHEDMWLDFTDDFNWRPGDFGDRGSCFWGSYRGTRINMPQFGYVALRAGYQNRNFKKGTASP